MPVAKNDIISRLELRFDYLSARNILADWSKAAGIAGDSLSAQSLEQFLAFLKHNYPHSDRALRSLCTLGGLDVEAFLAAPPPPAPAPPAPPPPAPPPPAPAPPAPPAPAVVVEKAPVEVAPAPVIVEEAVAETVAEAPAAPAAPEAIPEVAAPLEDNPPAEASPEPEPAPAPSFDAE